MTDVQGFYRCVEDVNPERNTLKVMLTILGRATPVELETEQVERFKAEYAETKVAI